MSDTNEPDLSGCKIEIVSLGIWGWGYKIKPPGGGQLGSGLNIYQDRSKAEAAALLRIERLLVAPEPTEFTGNELRDRVRGRDVA